MKDHFVSTYFSDMPDHVGGIAHRRDEFGIAGKNIFALDRRLAVFSRMRLAYLAELSYLICRGAVGGDGDSHDYGATGINSEFDDMSPDDYLKGDIGGGYNGEDDLGEGYQSADYQDDYHGDDYLNGSYSGGDTGGYHGSEERNDIYRRGDHQRRGRIGRFSARMIASDGFRERYMRAVSAICHDGVNIKDSAGYAASKERDTLSIYDRMYICKCIGGMDELFCGEKSGRSSGKADLSETVNDFFPYSSDLQENAESLVSYMKNAYSDAAFGKFGNALEGKSLQHALYRGRSEGRFESGYQGRTRAGGNPEERGSLKALYGASFREVCENVYYGRSEFCLLPVFSLSEGVLTGFCSLISKYELKAVLSCNIPTQDSGYTRFALLKKNIEYTDIRGKTVSFDFSVPSVGGNKLSVLLLAADFFGMTVLSVSSTPTEYSSSAFSYDIRCMAGADSDVRGLLCFLALEFPQYSQTGIYPNV